MNIVEGVVADHHKYIIPEKVDAAVVTEQSIKQAGRGETSYIHHHKFEEACEGHEHAAYGSVQRVAKLVPLEKK